MIITKHWPAPATDKALEEDAGLREAAAALAAGGVVAFPTETVYGLGGDARSRAAVERIFAAKGRPSDNPLIVHVADEKDAEALVEGPVGDIERQLMRAFWPGPLTLVLPARPGAVSPLVTAGLDTVAVRVPAHPVARALIAAAGCPVAAPSANRSGRPSPTEARHVTADLDGRIDGVLDGGPTGVGLESTVVRVVDGVAHVLRPGGVTAEQLSAALAGLSPVAAAAEDASEREPKAPRSPGVKYAHYAPRGEMRLITATDAQRLVAEVRRAADEARRAGRKVGVLACEEHARFYGGGREAGLDDDVIVVGSRAAPETAARALYAALRQCDERGCDFIVAEGFPETGIGAALMNRLRKAAGGRETRI